MGKNTYTPTESTTKTEDDLQRVIATGSQWKFAKVDITGENSRTMLASMRVEITGEEEHFYLVNVPDGWYRKCVGYHSTVRDANDKPILNQFCKLNGNYSETRIDQI